MRRSFQLLKKYGIVALALFVALTGSYNYLTDLISVSSNVNGRELPIYSVETNEKKIALSFDAAWGNVRYGFVKCGDENECI